MPKVWLITGSSGSLGRTIAEAALAARDKVLASAREPARLQDQQALPTSITWLASSGAFPGSRQALVIVIISSQKRGKPSS